MVNDYKNGWKLKMNDLIFVGLVFGLVGWLLHFIFIMTAMFSKIKWFIWVDYNKYHEGYLEVILISMVIGLYIIIIILEF